MKTKGLIKLLVGMTLAASGAFAVGSAVSNKKAESVEAAGDTLVEGTNIYLAGSGDIDITGATLSAWVWYTSGGSHWETFDYDALSGYYMITLDSAANGLTFARCSTRPSNNSSTWGDAGTVYNQTDMNFASGKNWIWPKSWSNSITCEWRYISYHLAGSFTDPTWQGALSTYKMTDGFDDDGNHQASIIFNNTTANTQVKCTANYNGTVPSGNWYGTLASGYNTTHVGSDSGNIVLKTVGSYEIYLKSDRTVWVQISSADEADHYAQEFLTTITCSDNSVTSSLSAWNKVGSATTSMEYKWEQLTHGAQNVLKGATGNLNGTNVQKCIARYDRILGKYGYGSAEGQYHDFMGRTPAPISGARLMLPVNESNTTNISIIVIISLVSVTAIGGFFFIKKRQEN